MIEKQKATLMRRRKIAIAVTVSLVAILIPVLILAITLARSAPFYDVDETKYMIKYKNGAYALYDMDGNKLKVDGQYGYYITALGSLVELDSTTGACEIIAIVEPEGMEELGVNYRIMMFPHVEKKNIRAIEVVNDNGSFTFQRFNLTKNEIDNTSDFIIKGSPFTTYDQDLFAKLYVNAGYTLTTLKLDDPLKDERGEFSEYGLVAEKRVDEEGNEYDYTPAYYVLTDTSGNKHKVILGDMLVTGEGYYVQYVEIKDGVESKRDAVYVLDTSMGTTMLAPVEDYVTPMIVHPMGVNTYTDVENFFISHKNDAADGSYDTVVGFSYVDLSLRENTINSSNPFVFKVNSLSGYNPSSDDISAALYYLYETEYEGVIKLNPSKEEFIKYGLAIEKVDGEGNTGIEFMPEYILSYEYDTRDDNNNIIDTIKLVVMISEKNERGNYYAYTLIYDKDGKDILYTYNMIVEVKGYCLEFLNWKTSKWIDPSYMSLNIPFCEEITITSPTYSATFTLDNSKSDQSEKSNTDNLVVIAKDSNGNDIRTFSSLTVIDKSYNVWNITASEITAYNSSGTKLTITSAYYAYNKIDGQVRCIKGQIDCIDGSNVRVTPDEVIVTDAQGNKTTYVRYATPLFRDFYQNLIVSTVEHQYEMTKEDEEALVNDPSKLLLTVTIKTTEGETRVYKFYALNSARKAYLTVNGTGGFCVLTNRVDKFVSDAQRFFAFEPIDPTSKN
ncbi:MAG: hypothetical protein J6Q77_03205 [Clostridia bacterium]|nr:hypothetical protein [Clostridia bacterium]